ncbi:hypothetical protein BS17DRAFT_150803 [Gyrodon lividus]|nr:hypothetical protein BS17DRAFT_150803 [Gyrodon lividus]
MRSSEFLAMLAGIKVLALITLRDPWNPRTESYVDRLTRRPSSIFGPRSAAGSPYSLVEYKSSHLLGLLKHYSTIQ